MLSGQNVTPPCLLNLLLQQEYRSTKTAAEQYMRDLYPISFELQGRTHSRTIMISSLHQDLAMPQTSQGTDLLGPVRMQLCRRCGRSSCNKACGLRR